MSLSHIEPAPLTAFVSLFSGGMRRPKARLLSDFGRLSLLVAAGIMMVAVWAQRSHEASQMRLHATARAVQAPFHTVHASS